jgi:inosine-uridine nucleoside N-ribohydrolase
MTNDSIRHFLVAILTMTVCGLSSGQSRSTPVKLFLDTDVAPDPGDLTAITMMHGLADLGEVEIIGITCVNSGQYVPGCVDALNRLYGRPNIPIGQLKDSDFLGKDRYTKNICLEYPNRYPDGGDSVPDAVAVFRSVLSRQPDGSVLIASIGPFRNLRNFLQSRPDSISPLSGIDLIKKKVKLICAMAGIFRPVMAMEGKDIYPGKGNYAEWNILVDKESAIYFSKNWPTPIVYTGYEIGWAITPDGELLRRWPGSPVSRAVGPKGRPGWDQTAILYCARGAAEYWNLTTEGCVEIYPDGSCEWSPAPNKHHCYLIERMSAEEMAKLIGKLEADAGQSTKATENSAK